MSINPSGASETDYSDFEYQQTSFAVSHRATDLTGSPASSLVLQEVDVLDAIGSLDNNEVAELVYVELKPRIEHDQDTADQDVGSETKLKYAFGANFNDASTFLPDVGPGLDQTVENTQNVNQATSVGASRSEDRVFARGRLAKTPAFDDQTNGPGGGGSSPAPIQTRPYRDIVGRGPVLDSSDTLACGMELFQGDEIITAIGAVDVHMAWDIAETSDAGRAFSVPMSD